MPEDDETARVRAAYTRYAEDGRELAKRDLGNRGNRVIAADTDQQLRRALAFLPPLSRLDVLEVGCGDGSQLARLIAMGADPRKVVGADILEERIHRARLALTTVRFEVSEPDRLAFETASYDLVLAITLFGSILDFDLARRLAGEMLRVLRPAGSVLWLENRRGNPANPDVRGYSKADVAALFPGARLRLWRATVVPPLVRRLGGAAPALYPLLAALPPLRVRWVGLVQKAG